MGETAQNSDLSNRLLLSLCLAKLRPIVLFDRDFLSTRLMDAFFDHCIRANTDLIAKVVNTKIVATRC